MIDEGLRRGFTSKAARRLFYIRLKSPSIRVEQSTENQANLIDFLKLLNLFSRQPFAI